MLRTLSTIQKLHVGRLLSCTKGVEHLGPAAPESEGKEEAESQAKERPDGCMGTYLIGSGFQNISVGVLQVMLEVFFRELADVLAHVLAEDSKRVGGHCRLAAK